MLSSRGICIRICPLRALLLLVGVCLVAAAAGHVAAAATLASTPILSSNQHLSMAHNRRLIPNLRLSVSAPSVSALQIRGGGPRSAAKSVDKQQNRSNDNLPSVSAVLIPRTLSIPRLIRLFAAILLTSSLCGCLATSGIPYENAVRTILGKPIVPSASGSSAATNKIPKLTPLDHFLAKKMAQAQREILPPKHLPGTGPLLGCLASLMLHFGLTVLLPRWVVMFDALLNYRIYDLSRLDRSGDNNDTFERIQQYLEDGVGGDGDDDFYSSSLLSRAGGSGSDNAVTGVAVLVRLSEAERMSSRDKRSHVIYWIHYCDELIQDEGVAGSSTSRKYYFEHSQRRIYFDPANGQCVDGGPKLHESTVHELLELAKRGLSDEKDLEIAKARFAKYNTFSLPQPTVKLAFAARVSSPLAVLQILGKLLTVLEENIVSSSLSLIMTVVNHFMAARSSIVASTELAAEIRTNAEEVGETKVWILRKGVYTGNQNSRRKTKIKEQRASAWQLLSASELLPGDVFFLPSAGSGKSFNMPIDALILDGGCITDEAVLTGESVPQVKRPLDDDDSMDEVFDMDGMNRGSVLFAGTTVLHCDNGDNADEGTNEDASSLLNITGVKCLALRTGSYSSEGEIVRSLSKSAGRYGQISNADTERDALKLIAALSCFAVFSYMSLFIPSKSSDGMKATNMSPFRLIIQFTRILVASIPSDIPLAISAIASSCTKNLRKEAEVVCSEPGSLLTAAHVDVMVFDKTGTLTAETQTLKRVIPPPMDDSGAKAAMERQHSMVEAVLAGCHSLESIEADRSNGRLVGDPVDLACLDYSQWAYEGGRNRTAYIRHAGNAKIMSTRGCSPARIWQIKTFPFDANRRCSSALLLVMDTSGRYRLFKVAKGSPDRMRAKVRGIDEEFGTWYDDQVHRLSSRGARIITLAVQEVPNDDAIASTLFPRQFLAPVNSKRIRDIDKKIASAIKKARRLAIKSVHRADVEEVGIFEFAGLAYFSASLRPSTPRVINQLQDSGLHIQMLTGDGLEAATSIASQAGIIKAKQGEAKTRRRPKSADIAILDVNKRGKRAKNLVWTLTKRGKSSKSRTKKASVATTSRIFDRGTYSIVCSGEAIDLILSEDGEEDYSYIRDKLSVISVIARASPSTKENVVRRLKQDHTIMMIGDGVNDIGAMKLADVSAALLNGFGSESSSTTDMEDSRRLQRLLKERKKAKRSKASQSGHDIDAATFAKQKLQAKLMRAIDDFKETSSFKGLIASFKNIMKDERLRKSALKKGGGEAARILNQEDKLRMSLMEKTGKATGNDIQVALQDDGDDEALGLKPGEACLAADCTLLRPCIDGAEAIVRGGVAAAACSLTVHRSIALNSLMACFNLVMLYKDGFRYGKFMWNTEFAFLSIIDQYCFESSCKMRPKIPHLRPETTIFSRSGTISILGQAFVHLMVLYTGTDLGKTLEQATQARTPKGLRIKWADSGIANTLQAATDEAGANTGILGRPKFRPNHVTNAVFVLSVFQNTVTSLVNHLGPPYFYGKILENRNLVLSILTSLLFCIACVSESFPEMNSFLQLAPMPSKKAKLAYLALFALDLAGCYAVQRISQCFVMPDLKERHERTTTSTGTTAADKEEEMLLQDATENRSLVFSILIIAFGLIGKDLW